MAHLGINNNHGLHLTFNNGFTLSVQIGPYNYCDNRDMADCLAEDHRARMTRVPESATAEIAVWPHGGDMIRLSEYDTVQGWFPVEQLGQLILKVQAADATEESIREFVEAQVY